MAASSAAAVALQRGISTAGHVPLRKWFAQLTGAIRHSSGLPTGLTAVLTGKQISFTGTPTTVKTFATGSITIHDAAGASVTKTFSITINPPLSITTVSLPASKMAMLYSADVDVTGGTGAVTFAITGGSLSPGMKLSPSGDITGVSRGIGSFTFTITATDAVGDTLSKKYTLLLSLPS